MDTMGYDAGIMSTMGLDLSWWSIFSDAAREAGFGPVTTLIMGIGIAVLMYLGKILKGIRSGYGTILQDQKDAADSLREQVVQEREERLALFNEVTSLRRSQVKHLKALAAAEALISSHGLEVPTAIIETIGEITANNVVQEVIEYAEVNGSTEGDPGVGP